MTERRSWPSLLIRIPPSMKTWLVTEAKRNSASQNNEVIRALIDRRDRILLERHKLETDHQATNPNASTEILHIDEIGRSRDEQAS